MAVKSKALNNKTRYFWFASSRHRTFSAEPFPPVLDLSVKTA